MSFIGGSIVHKTYRCKASSPPLSLSGVPLYRKRELMGRYLQLLASLEHHTFTAQRHSQVLDELVDLVDFSKN